MENFFKWALAVAIIILLYVAFDQGKRITEKKYEIEIDNRTQQAVDSMFNQMILRIDSFKRGIDSNYILTIETFNKIVKSNEKVDAIKPIYDRDSLLKSLHRISETY